MKPDKAYLEAVLPRVRESMETRYGLLVSFVALPPPFTGDLDGVEVRIHPDHGIEPRLFTLAHLFGHTVQWNTSDAATSLATAAPGAYDAAQIAAVAAYEREASRYGLQLLHETGIADLDQWLSDFAAADLAFLAHFYRTGEKLAPERFWRDGQPLLEPLAIPAFQPRRRKFRWDGVVL